MPAWYSSEVELRRLRYFVAVADELSFSRAASQLHVAQPALSRQIQQLEDELGVLLFDRTRRAIALTEAGKVLLDEANRLIEHADRTADLVRQVDSGRTGRLGVDFLPSACSRLLPPILTEFRSAHPAVSLVLRERKPDEIVDAVKSGHADIGFVYAPFVRETSLQCEPILREPFVVALPEHHFLASEAELEMSDLADENFILGYRYSTTGLHDKIAGLCQRSGFAPIVVQEVWLLQTALSLVSAGIGVTLVPWSMQEVQRTGVVYTPIRECPCEVEYDLLWRPDNTSPVVRSFVGVVREWSRNAPAPS